MHVAYALQIDRWRQKEKEEERPNQTGLGATFQQTVSRRVEKA